MAKQLLEQRASCSETSNCPPSFLSLFSATSESCLFLCFCQQLNQNVDFVDFPFQFRQSVNFFSLWTGRYFERTLPKGKQSSALLDNEKKTPGPMPAICGLWKKRQTGQEAYILNQFFLFVHLNWGWASTTLLSARSQETARVNWYNLC